MPNEKILLILSDPETGELLERAALLPAGYQVTTATAWDEAEATILNTSPDIVIIGDQLEGRNTTELTGHLLKRYPPVPVILMPTKHSDSLAIQ